MKIFLILIAILALGCTENNITASSKWKKLNNKKHSLNQFSGKARSNVQSQIITRHQSNGSMTLIGSISPLIDMDNVEVEWKIPKHIEIISGHEKESLKIQQGTTNVHEITIQKKSLKEDDRIFFFVYQMKDGERVGSSAQYFHQTLKADGDNKHQFKKISDKKKRKIIQ